jgi:hypothetical protein
VRHTILSHVLLQQKKKTGALYIWHLIYQPTNITNLLGNWLYRVDKKEKAHIRVGVCAFLWAICMPGRILTLTKHFPSNCAAYPFGYLCGFIFSRRRNARNEY